MTDEQKIIQDINESTILLVEALANIRTKDFSKKPTPKSWSVGDVAEHILTLETGVNQIMLGPTQKTDRDITKKTKRIKSTFLNYDKKLRAGGPINPTDKEKDQNKIIAEIEACRLTLTDIIATNDPGKECLAFKHALFGRLTRAEWTYFNIFHSQRHVEQIQRIKKELNKNGS